MSANMDPSIFGIFEDLILTKNGIWLSNGEPITHEKTIAAFSKNLFRCPEGFEIRLGKEHKVIHVEDTLYFIIGMEGDPELGYTIRLNDGRALELDPSTLQYKPGRLTCKVPHPNEGTQEEAKFLTQSYYELLRFLEKTPEGFEIKIEGKRILLSKE